MKTCESKKILNNLANYDIIGFKGVIHKISSLTTNTKKFKFKKGIL
ncbi:hypothetical protein [Campylobacter blaseri]|nr:hypothetical protein [Campylobacter blaseri]